jgi:LmbE family N-acetylglucosaminyl deacetylase
MKKIQLQYPPRLNSDFVPAKLWNEAYLQQVSETRDARRVTFRVGRPNERAWTLKTRMLPAESRFETLNRRYGERMVKALLRSWGGCSLEIVGAPDLVAYLETLYEGDGQRAFDARFMGSTYFGQSFRIEGVSCTDGAGSSCSGPYAEYGDKAMKAVRMKEQQVAAQIGQYSFMEQLAHSSAAAKEAVQRSARVDDLETILKAIRPTVVYTHNPFDKHATHVGVLLAVIEAIGRLRREERPRHLFGCEVWRGLDWLPDEMKVVRPLDAHPNLAAALNGVFDSQITGGKRYDLAVEGRRRANATFFDSHSVDNAQRVAYAVDLTGLPELGAKGSKTFSGLWCFRN